MQKVETEDAEEIFARGAAWGQQALKDAGKLVVVDSPELMELRAAIEAKDAEIARLRGLVDEAVDLIRGDLVGAEWKQACRAFVKRAALQEQPNG